MSAAASIPTQRPLLRGILHLGAFIAAIIGIVVMLLLAHTARGYVGAAIFLASRASDFITGQTYFVDGGSNLI